MFTIGSLKIYKIRLELGPPVLHQGRFPPESLLLVSSLCHLVGYGPLHLSNTVALVPSL